MNSVSFPPIMPTAQTTVCKVCSRPAKLYGVVDFNRNCGEPNFVLPLTGIPIYYHRCEHCSTIFSRAFDAWKKQDFQTYIYNEDYLLVDPEYTGARAMRAADVVCQNFSPNDNFKILDFGGGNGGLSAILREKGFQIESWDPMSDDIAPETKQFDLLLSIEVLEHSATPIETVSLMLSYLKSTGTVLFTTLTFPEKDPSLMSHSYFAPRNGHITIYTKSALQHLFAIFGYQVQHLNENWHYATK